MKRILVLLSIIIVFSLVLSGCSAQNAGTGNEAPDSPAKVSQVKIYLIALDDNGKSGEKLVTGDSLVPVDRKIEPTQAPLKAALTELLALKGREYEEGGLLNPLYLSDLKIDSVTVADGKATIHLSGKLSVAGDMDGPRIEAQIKATAEQFPTVQETEIFINDKKLEETLSLK